MAGIYIHIPFCKQKCSYCDFHFSTTFEVYRQEMIDAICAEIIQRKSYINKESISSIYFGGGTPSILTETEINQLLSTIRDHFSIEEGIEITLEANPDDIQFEVAKSWFQAGINRLSIGLQSFKQSDLEWMNRAHNMQQSHDAVPIAQSAGFTNLSIDLIYGLPNLTLEEWKNHIDIAIKLGVNHISAYCLTVENKTELHKLVETGKIIPASEDMQSDQFQLLVNRLVEHEFEQYEISNFCAPNHEAKHNSNYWKGINYIGVGPSAHSFNGISRSWNIRNNQLYIKKSKQGAIFWETEILSPQNQLNELLLTGLRTKYGVETKRIHAFEMDLTQFWLDVETFKSDSLIYQTDTHIYLTETGKLQADRIASDLFQVD